MTTYQIHNSKSGTIIGVFAGATEAEALEAMARDAGYRSYAECCEVAPVAEGQIVLTEVAADAEPSEVTLELLNATQPNHEELRRLGGEILGQDCHGKSLWRFGELIVERVVVDEFADRWHDDIAGWEQ